MVGWEASAEVLEDSAGLVSAVRRSKKRLSITTTTSLRGTTTAPTMPATTTIQRTWTTQGSMTIRIMIPATMVAGLMAAEITSFSEKYGSALGQAATEYRQRTALLRRRPLETCTPDTLAGIW